MFNRLSLVLVLSASLSCLAQVATIGGTATTAGAAIPVVPMSAANAPLISTPEIALPGSGPAVGAPLSSAAANDSRTTAGPSVYNPNGSAYPVPAPATANVATANVATVPTSSEPSAATGVASPAPTEPFQNGIQHFESGLPASSNPTQSLAQIARANRAQRPQAKKTFNNDSIVELNARGVRTGNLGPETSTVVATAQPSNQPEQASGEGLMAQSQPPALPQSDQNLAASSSASPSPTAWQQRHKATEQSSSASAKASQEQNSAAPSSLDQNKQKQTAALPQTGSPLPLLLLLGGLGVVGGVAYWLRR